MTLCRGKFKGPGRLIGLVEGFTTLLFLDIYYLYNIYLRILTEFSCHY